MAKTQGWEFRPRLKYWHSYLKGLCLISRDCALPSSTHLSSLMPSHLVLSPVQCKRQNWPRQGTFRQSKTRSYDDDSQTSAKLPHCSVCLLPCKWGLGSSITSEGSQGVCVLHLTALPTPNPFWMSNNCSHSGLEFWSELHPRIVSGIQ